MVQRNRLFRIAILISLVVQNLAPLFAPPPAMACHGSVSGYKYHDLNGDGDWDKDDEMTPDINEQEPALNGWTVNLKQGTDTIATAVTGNGDWEDGFYTFENVEVGTYTVEEVLQTGWIQSEAPDEFIVKLGVEETNLNFGNYQKVSIMVCKKVDTDGDGNGDNPYPDGWTMTLFKGGVQFGEPQETDGEGCYTWSDFEPGSYSVSEEDPANWTPMKPTTHDFGQVMSGEEKEWTFVNYKNRNIYGHKYEDLNGNGQKDPDEQYLNDWEIKLTRRDGTVPNCAEAGDDFCLGSRVL